MNREHILPRLKEKLDADIEKKRSGWSANVSDRVAGALEYMVELSQFLENLEWTELNEPNEISEGVSDGNRGVA